MKRRACVRVVLLLPFTLLLGEACSSVPPEDPAGTVEASLQGLEISSPKPAGYLDAMLVTAIPGGLGDGIAAYYDVISTNLTLIENGQLLTGAATTSTFDRWKKTFRFSPRDTAAKPCTTSSQCKAGCSNGKCRVESMQKWRDRTGVAVYYNANELGLGRELGCSRFTDPGSGGKTGWACFVTNYGTFFQAGEQEGREPVLDAMYGVYQKNTVCITFRPSLTSPFETQFWVFDGDGNRQTWAQLDHMGKRPVPQVCTRCHGGASGGLHASGARFLPLNPELVKWPDEIIAQPDLATGLTKAGQQERVRKINVIAQATNLTSMQHLMVNAMYSGTPNTPGTVAVEPIIGNWGTKGKGTFFKKVITPYCGTCHFAFSSVWIDNWDIFRPMAQANMFNQFVCSDPKIENGHPIMPNAEPTVQKFWGGGTFNSHATFKDWFFAEPGAAGCTTQPLGCAIKPLNSTCNADGMTLDGTDYCSPQKANNLRCGEVQSGRSCHGLCNDQCLNDSHCPPQSRCVSSKCQACGKYGRLACKKTVNNQPVLTCDAPYVVKGLACDLSSNPLNKQPYCQGYVRQHFENFNVAENPSLQAHLMDCTNGWPTQCDEAAYSGKWLDLSTDPGCWEYVVFP